MLTTIQEYIETNQLLITRDAPVIVGLSGGADSVALLAILHQLGYSCIAAHCNFHLRDEESERDEQFAKMFASTLSVPFHKIDFPTEEYAKEKGISIEMAARELRYEWFETLLIENRAQAIAVAHHQDDSIETVLMNLTRGTGIKGLRGMLPRNGFIVRPLLCVNREQIVHWLMDESFPYVTDSSNNQDVYTRNFIRLRVLPLLEEINPSVRTAILRTANHLREIEGIYDYVIKEARQKIMSVENELSIPQLLEYPSPETILYELLHPYGFNRFTVNNIFQVLDKEPGKLFFSDNYQLVKDRNSLLIKQKENGQPVIYQLREKENVCNMPVKLFWEKAVIDKEFCIQKNKNIAYFDYDKISFPLTIRLWQPGDWFIPFGMNGKKKLSDYFTNQKINRLDKDRIWILCSGEDIIWIVGERADNRFRIKENTRCALIVKFSD